MKQHTASELRYTADLLDTDGTTVIVSQVGVGISDLAGRRLEQAQLMAAETTHMLLMRWVEAQPLPPQGYIRVTDPGSGLVTLYIVDAPPLDPRVPRPRVWVEIYCHVTRTN